MKRSSLSHSKFSNVWAKERFSLLPSAAPNKLFQAA